MNVLREINSFLACDSIILHRRIRDAFLLNLENAPDNDLLSVHRNGGHYVMQMFVRKCNRMENCVHERGQRQSNNGESMHMNAINSNYAQ